MGSGGTDTDPSSCSRTFCSPVSFRYWMKCLRAVGLDASSRNRTSKQGEAEGEHWPTVPGPAVLCTHLYSAFSSGESEPGGEKEILLHVTSGITLDCLSDHN